MSIDVKQARELVAKCIETLDDNKTVEGGDVDTLCTVINQMCEYIEQNDNLEKPETNIHRYKVTLIEVTTYTYYANAHNEEEAIEYTPWSFSAPNSKESEWLKPKVEIVYNDKS